jgi:hypothetical protein
MKSVNTAACALLFAAAALAAWSIGQMAAVAALLSAALIVAVGARECRAAFGDALKRKVEQRFGPGPLAPGSTLVAVVCPDQLEHLPSLVARASEGPGALVVLAIEPVEDERLVLPRSAAEVLRAEDPRVRAALARALANAERPVTFMTAAGRDAAAVTLDVARRIAAREVFAISLDRDAADEDARRAARVWQGLPTPKAPLSVRLVVNACDDRQVALAPDPASPA